MAEATAALLRNLPGELSSALTPQFVALNTSLATLATTLNTNLTTLTTTFSADAKVDRDATFAMFKLLFEKK